MSYDVYMKSIQTIQASECSDNCPPLVISCLFWRLSGNIRTQADREDYTLDQHTERTLVKRHRKIHTKVKVTIKWCQNCVKPSYQITN